MARFQDSIEVKAPANVSYQQWSQFENYPLFMRHVKRVTNTGEKKWRWEIEGPRGKRLDWISKLDGNQENRLLSWHSIEEPAVGIQAAVLFEEINAHSSRIIFTMQYEPEDGQLGQLMGEVFSNPQQMLQDDLNNFKRFIESQSAYHTQHHY